MKTHLFKLECLTDLHVGNGDSNYSVIDNEVQKDSVLTDVPIIHASGVKGALKEHFERLWNPEKIKNIFGNEEGSGSYKFFTAMCIARPLRVSCGDRPYILATSTDILKNFSGFLRGLGCAKFYSKEECAKFYSEEDNSKETGTTIEVEGEPAKITKCDALKSLIGDEFVIIDNLGDYDLPVRARNVLDENGQSKNIWHEEFVPHKSVFYFAVITPEDTCELEFTKDCAVQFGGNASIGNGYCIVTEVFSS